MARAVRDERDEISAPPHLRYYIPHYLDVTDLKTRRDIVYLSHPTFKEYALDSPAVVVDLYP